jgi:hypothetical protein
MLTLTTQQSLTLMLLGLLIIWMIICSYMALRRDAKVQVAYQEAAQSPVHSKQQDAATHEEETKQNEKAALSI